MLEAPWQRSEDVQEGNPAASGRNQERCSCLPAGGRLEGGVSERGQTAAGAGRRITTPGPGFQHRISGGMFLVQGTWMISGFQNLFREAVVSPPRQGSLETRSISTELLESLCPVQHSPPALGLRRAEACR